jgi:pimeloyl-ACP methyl ester carboxylesterase
VIGGLAFRASRLRGAPPVVLVHGLGVSSSYFRPLLRELRGRADLLAPDLPGFGRTPGPTQALGIEGLADALGGFVESQRLERPLLLGNSLGCQVAVDLAVRRPDLVGGLALVGPTVDPAAQRFLPQFGRLVVDAFREHPLAVVGVTVDYVRVGPRRILETALAALADPIAEKLSRVVAPGVVIRGSDDPLAPERWCEHVARVLGGELVTIQGAAHATHWSHPAQTASALERLPAHLRPGTPPPPR